MVVAVPRRVLYLATHNEGKVREIKQMLGEQWDIRRATELDPQVHWEESGSTFEDNAKIKAIELSQLTQEAVLAEDSGLCVEALGGAPGVYSKRYAGPEEDDQANMAKLLQALAGKPPSERRAYFVCSLVYLDPQGDMQSFEGRCYGSIAEEPRGTGGFGYDPIFIPDASRLTLAEMEAAQKNAISHRRQALEKWAGALWSSP